MFVLCTSLTSFFEGSEQMSTKIFVGPKCLTQLTVKQPLFQLLFYNSLSFYTYSSAIHLFLSNIHYNL